MVAPQQMPGPGQAFWEFLSTQNLNTWGRLVVRHYSKPNQTLNATRTLCQDLLFTQHLYKPTSPLPRCPPFKRNKKPTPVSSPHCFPPVTPSSAQFLPWWNRRNMQCECRELDQEYSQSWCIMVRYCSMLPFRPPPSSHTLPHSLPHPGVAFVLPPPTPHPSSYNLSPSWSILFPSSMPYNRPVKATQCGLPIPVPTGFFLHVGLLYSRKALRWPATKKGTSLKIGPKQKKKVGDG